MPRPRIHPIVVCCQCERSFTPGNTNWPTKPATSCPDCRRQAREARKQEQERKRAERGLASQEPRPSRHMSPDPCPICQTPQAEHWRCRKCASRGHLIPQSARYPDYCEWCEKDAIKHLQKATAR